MARQCNIQCRYCDRNVGERYHSFRPGVAGRIIRPGEVPKYIRAALRRCPDIEVVGVAGPGDPLANRETFEALRVARLAFPRMKLCVCTNGLLLPEKVAELAELGVEYLTITINAATPRIAAKVYAQAGWHGAVLRGRRAGQVLIKNQFGGLERAVAAGMVVKVNSVLVPRLNDGELPLIAERAASLGARIMNIMPLIPAGELARHRAPECGELQAARAACEAALPQFRLCKQCRADACGVPGLGDFWFSNSGRNVKGDMVA